MKYYKYQRQDRARWWRVTLNNTNSPYWNKKYGGRRKRYRRLKEDYKRYWKGRH